MSFAQELSSRVKRHLSNLKRLYDERVDRATARARKQLATAKTKTAKETIKLQLQRDKMDAKKELYEAQIATQKAKDALEVARKEAGDLTLGERFSKVARSFGRVTKSTYKGLVAPPRRRTSRRRTTKGAKAKTRAKTPRT